MTAAKALRWLTWACGARRRLRIPVNEKYKLSAPPQAGRLFTRLTDWMHLDGHEEAFRLFHRRL